jgi:hypothetical protein
MRDLGSAATKTREADCQPQAMAVVPDEQTPEATAIEWKTALPARAVASTIRHV